jgi:hypothetical protein
MVDPSSPSVATFVRLLSSKETDAISAYWLCVDGDRDSYALQLRKLLQGTDIAVIVVRTAGFTNPNSLMRDMAQLLDKSRAPLMEFFGSLSVPPVRISIVLLARSELRIPQSSSPVLWPDWVPGVGGLEVLCHIQDITRSIDVPLNSAEIDVGRLATALYELEWAILRRLRIVHATKPSAHNELYELVRRKTDPGGWLGFLTQVDRALENEGVIASYRPTGRGNGSICGRLWAETQSRDSAFIESVGVALTAALDLPPSTESGFPRESLFSVLSRISPATLSAVPSVRFARDLLVTNSSACQLIASAAHAGDYGRYPLRLLQAVVDELYLGIVGFEALLNRLPSVENN